MLSDSETKIFVTPEELAKLWGVSAMTLKVWRMKGKGPRYVKIGRRVRYRIEDVAEYVAANTIGAES